MFKNSYSIRNKIYIWPEQRGGTWFCSFLICVSYFNILVLSLWSKWELGSGLLYTLAMMCSVSHTSLCLYNLILTFLFWCKLEYFGMEFMSLLDLSIITLKQELFLFKPLPENASPLFPRMPGCALYWTGQTYTIPIMCGTVTLGLSPGKDHSSIVRSERPVPSISNNAEIIHSLQLWGVAVMQWTIFEQNWAGLTNNLICPR